MARWRRIANIKVVEKVWRNERHDFLKTESGEREVDLHSSVAKMLREYIGKRTSGLLFSSKSGGPLLQSNILGRTLHPILESIHQPKCGAHAFRRFRNTYLRNRTACPEGVRNFWMGWAGEGMGDLYDKIREDVAFRKECAERAGVGFTIPPKPVKFASKKTQLVHNGPQNAVGAEAVRVA